MSIQSESFCLIGHPLGHTLSPFIHQRLFALMGRQVRYDAQDIAPEALATELPALLSHIQGCNVTIPHKQAVLPFLSRLEGKAARYQTVNCIAVTQDGTVGYNTDADGFLCALRDAGVALSGRALLMGCGGVGTVFACEAALAGCEVTLYDALSRERAETLAARVKAVAPNAHCLVADALPREGAFDLLINATPVGMYPNTDASAADEDLISRSAAVFDAVYNPRQTKLLKTAAAFGKQTLGGMSMLVWQAAVSHTYWYGAQFDSADIARLIDDCYEELGAFPQMGGSK